MLLRYFLIAWYHFRIHVSQALNFYCKISIIQNVLASILITFLYPETAVSINRYVLCLLSWSIISILLLLSLFSYLFEIYFRLLLGGDPLVILDLNKNSKRFTPAFYEWSVQCSLVWSFVALWLTGYSNNNINNNNNNSTRQAGVTWQPDCTLMHMWRYLINSFAFLFRIIS